MRENRTHGSEGGGTGTNRLLLPLSKETPARSPYCISAAPELHGPVFALCITSARLSRATAHPNPPPAAAALVVGGAESLFFAHCDSERIAYWPSACLTVSHCGQFRHSARLLRSVHTHYPLGLCRCVAVGINGADYAAMGGPVASSPIRTRIPTIRSRAG